MLDLLLYLGCGVFTGLLSGLLGLGGGIVIVPLLNVILHWQNIDASTAQHLALGTSMAAITFTSISSVMSHNKRGGVRWDIWKKITPGIIFGTFCGTFVAASLSATFLKIFFAIFLMLVAMQMVFKLDPKPSRGFPSFGITSGIGTVIGVICSFVGIGGGTITVPLMTWCNVPMRQAVGTSASIGIPIAITGAIGYMINGQNFTLPAYSLGFIYLPALVGIVVASMLTAPLGVKLAHTLPVDKLRRYFCIFIIIMAVRMLWSVI